MDEEGVFCEQVKWHGELELDILVLSVGPGELVDMVSSAGTVGVECIRSEGSEMYKEGVVGSTCDGTEGDMQDDGGL